MELLVDVAIWVPFEVGAGTLFQRQTLLLGLEASVARKPRKCRNTGDAQAPDGERLEEARQCVEDGPQQTVERGVKEVHTLHRT